MLDRNDSSRVRLADAAVLGAYAIAAGLLVAAFTLASGYAFAVFKAISRWSPMATLLWTPALTAAGVWAIRRWAPGTAGSGIPQVMAAAMAENELSRFASLKISALKLLLSSAALGAGLSVGREGPSVQIAAGVMVGAQRHLRSRRRLSARTLLIVGGSAGVAAAFNAPIAGAVFAFEQLSQGGDRPKLGWIAVGVLGATVASRTALGNGHAFPPVEVAIETASFWAAALISAIACGVGGGLFSRLLIGSLTNVRALPNRWRARWPVAFAAVCGLVVAAIGLASDGATLGGGTDTLEELIKGRATLPVSDTPLKFIATWLTSWCGTSGGLLAPSLSMGGGVGDLVAHWLAPGHRAPLIAIGMAAFLAAVTQTPLTAAFIVAEMSGSAAAAIGLLPAALIASGLSRLISRPLYATLSDSLVPAPAASTAASQAVVMRLTEPARVLHPPVVDG